MLDVRTDLETAADPQPTAASLGELVSVIIPAYNAAATIDATLVSVRSQSYRNLEVIVVDDGSTDETLAIARRHAAADCRVRVVQQANGGVAAARNHGIAIARGRYVAPVDADDLWAPDKILEQMRAVAAGDDVVLAYTWHARIDPLGRVLNLGHAKPVAGDTLRAMCRRNLVGNGSAALMRRADVLAVGGYDASLRARRAQGCEDYKLYLQLAARGKVVAPRGFLTGYRVMPGNMSGDFMQMCRSYDLVIEEMRAQRPDLWRDLMAGRGHFMRWMVFRALRERRLDAAAQLLAAMAQRHPGPAALLAMTLPYYVAHALVRMAYYSLQPKGPLKNLFPIGQVDGGA